MQIYAQILVISLTGSSAALAERRLDGTVVVTLSLSCSLHPFLLFLPPRRLSASFSSRSRFLFALLRSRLRIAPLYHPVYDAHFQRRRRALLLSARSRARASRIAAGR